MIDFGRFSRVKCGAKLAGNRALDSFLLVGILNKILVLSTTVYYFSLFPISIGKMPTYCFKAL